MDHCRGRVAKLLVDYLGEDVAGIDHALAVLHHAERLASERGDCDLEVLIASALLHDVGIKPAMAELGRCDADAQERYGPSVAEELLRGVGFPESKVVKVSQIVGNHHSPPRYDYAELEILRAADRVVNEG